MTFMTYINIIVFTVLYLTAAGLDIRRIVISGKSARLLRYADKTYDEACGLVRELGEKYQNVSQGNIILNLEGFNLVQTGCLRCNILKMLKHYLIMLM